MAKPKIISISDFKEKALGLLEALRQNGEIIVITKRGKPIAKVIPYSGEIEQIPGRLVNTILLEDDIISPLGSALWKSAK